MQCLAVSKEGDKHNNAPEGSEEADSLGTRTVISATIANKEDARD